MQRSIAPSAHPLPLAAAAELFARNPARGDLRAAAGDRIALLSAEFIRSLHFAIIEAYADGAQDVLYRSGFEWGLQTMLALNAHRPPPLAEAKELWQLEASTVLQSWWSPFAGSGWGASTFQLHAASPGVTHIELHHSAIADALGPTDDPVCHVYAGLFAGACSFVERSERHGVEVQCRAAGAESCRFVVGAASAVDAIETWRQQGVPVVEITARLGSGTAPGDHRPPASATAAVRAVLVSDARGRRVAAVAPELLRSLQFVFEKERAGSWAEVMKTTGRACGKRLASDRGTDLATAAGGAQPLDASLHFLQSHFGEYGWGKLTVDASGAAEYGIVTAQLAHSYFIDALPNDGRSLDPFPAGMLLGYLEHITGQTLACEEIASASPAAPTAVFALSTPEQLARVAPFIGREPAEQIIARLRS